MLLLSYKFLDVRWVRAKMNKYTENYNVSTFSTGGY